VADTTRDLAVRILAREFIAIGGGGAIKGCIVEIPFR
jgi:hypothetical protein